MNKEIKNRRKYYPITLPQSNFISEMFFSPFKKSEGDTIAFCFVVKGNASDTILEKSFNRLVYENDGLRIRFVTRMFRLYVRQYIANYTYEELERITVNDWHACERKMRELEKEISIDFTNHTKQYKAVIISFDKGKALFFKISHYCFDGYSANITANRLAKYYSAYEKGEHIDEPDSNLSIENFIKEEVGYKRSKKYRENIKYWKVENSKHKVEKPIPKSNPNSRIKEKTITLDGKLFNSLLNISVEKCLPMWFLINSVIGYTIYDLTGCKCFASTMYTHGRTKYNQFNTIGCMNYAFVYYFDINPTVKMIDNIRESYYCYLDSLKHSKVSFTKCFFFRINSIINNPFDTYFSLLINNVNINDYSEIDKERYYYNIISNIDSRPTQILIAIDDSKSDKIDVHVSYQEELFCSEIQLKIKDTFLKNIGRILEE